MAISATLVKELRERTSAAMMDCKRALEASNGDIEAAIEAMRASGQAKAIKKAGRVASEGVVVTRMADDRAVIMEVNCETDFVAMDDNFKQFVDAAADAALSSCTDDVETLLHVNLGESTVEEMRQNLVAKIGENIQVRRIVQMDSTQHLAQYVHGRKIGVLVEIKGGDDEVAKDLAMHIAACKPEVIRPEEVDAERQAKEKAFLIEQAQESGKPQEIIEKMIGGRMKKFLNEISLVGQAFVKDPSLTVADVLQQKQAEVLNFVRFEVGEGIEKEVTDFAKEVMEQVKGS